MSYMVKTFRVMLVCESKTPPTISTSDDAAEALEAFFSTLDQDRENFVVMALDARGRLIGTKAIHVGTAAACLVHPREVFGAAIAMSAASIIVAHNHPSGDPTPSQEDRMLTDRLREAGRIMGIPVTDSIVYGGGRNVRSIL